MSWIVKGLKLREKNERKRVRKDRKGNETEKGGSGEGGGVLKRTNNTTVNGKSVQPGPFKRTKKHRCK
jgi:hypothetical protein